MRFKIATTKNGKCDVIITLFTNDNSIFGQRSRTYDVKPTIKELKEEFKIFKPEGAKYIRITTMPSGMTKTYTL